MKKLFSIIALSIMVSLPVLADSKKYSDLETGCVLGTLFVRSATSIVQIYDPSSNRPMKCVAGKKYIKQIGELRNQISDLEAEKASLMKAIKRLKADLKQEADNAASRLGYTEDTFNAYLTTSE